MKTFWKWIVLLLFLVQFAMAQNGRVSIQSSPSDSWVRIDSILVGKTPLSDIQLQPGTHLIHIAPPKGGVWNYEDKYVEINLSANQDTTLTVTFQKPVYINSVPYGAHLKSETEHIGITPLYLPFEANHGSTFKLIKEGFEPYSFVLDKPDPIMAWLQKKEGYVEPEKKKPQLLGFLPKQNVKSKFTLLALTVATHWASFYFKNVADDKYDNYKNTADPELMDKYWDETRKYDRLSDISLGVSYAALTGLIYMVVWH